jgi:hypothetical protein
VTGEEGKSQVPRVGGEREPVGGVEYVRTGRGALVQVVPGGFPDVLLPSLREQPDAGSAGQVVVGGGARAARCAPGDDLRSVNAGAQRQEES